MEATSLPVSGSVMAKQPRLLPLTSPGMYLRFCSSVPQRWMVSAGPIICMLKGNPQEALTCATSMVISAEAR